MKGDDEIIKDNALFGAEIHNTPGGLIVEVFHRLNSDKKKMSSYGGRFYSWEREEALLRAFLCVLDIKNWMDETNKKLDQYEKNNPLKYEVDPDFKSNIKWSVDFTKRKK